MHAVRHLSGIATLVLAASLAAGQGAQAPGGIVSLPEYVVRDSRLLPQPEHWLYGTAPGFLVLSNASASATVDTVRNLQEFARAVGIVWPSLQQKDGAPVLLILCGTRGKFTEFETAEAKAAPVEVTTVSFRAPDEGAIIVDMDTSTVADPTSVAGGSMAVDPAAELRREYLHYLFGGEDPRPQPWLEEGISRLLSSMEVRRSEIVLGKLPESKGESVSDFLTANGTTSADGTTGSDLSTADASSQKAFNGVLATEGLMPLGEMFAMKRYSAQAMDSNYGQWTNQCWAFVHLCSFGENMRFKNAFLEFIARSSREGESEALFKECFKMSYRDMLFAIRSYTQGANYRFAPYKNLNLTEIPAIGLSDATDAESGRIVGDALEMAGNGDAAHTALIAPYVRGSRDPELLAALGIEEHDHGNNGRAIPLLATAVRAKTSRALAYVALAQTRLAQGEEEPAGAGGKLSDAQLVDVLTPLFEGRGVQPPLKETYDTMASAWSRAAAKPSAGNLEAVTLGARLFPRDTGLLYSDAVLHAQGGFKAEALGLAQAGVKMAPDDAERAKFAALEASLKTPSP